jgi:hypothetical protein
MAVVGNFYFSIFLQLTWEFLDIESERGASVCWPNNNIIDSDWSGDRTPIDVKICLCKDWLAPSVIVYIQFVLIFSCKLC